MTLNYVFILLVTRYILEIKSDNVCGKTICNPRAGDLLIGRESFLRASSTCGLTTSERYCVVTTSDSGRKSKCTICDSKNPYQKFSSTHSHRIENVVSRLPQDPFRWWQSVNGVHNVSIEISFESEFQFTFTHLRFKTYRPAAMYIERSKDYGRTWNKYAYFSDNCARDFPSIPERKRSNINEVLCTSEFSSIIPSEGGTVLFSADTSDWVNNDVYWNKKRNDITAITNIRVQFVRLHTFGDWKVDDNPNIRNKYYYAISEWIIRGRCSCYGHASKCKAKEGQIQIKEMVYGVCDCQHNTKGQHCEKCKDFYNDSPWLPADKNSTNECRKCECNSHSYSCHFDPVVYQQSREKSGGICDNCQHNTESKNCERCKSGYYRNVAVPINSPHTCLKCQCNSFGTKFPSICIQEPDLDRGLNAGHCMCKENVKGNQCDKCKIGFWKFNGDEESGCLKCNCVMMGTLENQGCDSSTGKCNCKPFVTDNDCSTCKIGYFNLSDSNPNGCALCKCSVYGSLDSKTCDKYSGKCRCKPGFTGIRCDEIKSEWYIEKPTYQFNYLNEIKINLRPVSKSGYYNFVITMDTKNMQFFDTYAIFLSISHIGKSSCQTYQDTMKLIKDSRYIVIPNKCLEKDLPITVTVFIIKSSNNRISPPSIIDIVVVPLLDVNSTKTRKVLGECLNHANLGSSKKCDFLNAEISTKTISKSDPLKCKCNVTGSRNNNCNKIGGQCQCLPNVSGKNCERCSPESYGFDARGCKKCKCDLTGSLNSQCYNDTGKCLCREGVEGQHCDICKSGYWNFPFCDSCKCNQMSTTCDSKTGKCLNCKGNSFGFNCQHCENGYYGDTSRGILCKKCQCPGLSTFKNNSIGCSLIFNTTTFTCMCKKGYSGQFCDKCETNHFGNAIRKEGTCQPCSCSGNINQMIGDSCDSKTGECRKCLFNTSGFNCEKCASGYFGNGVIRTCKKCVCNHMGTNPKWQGICDHETGKCPCLPNVVGLQCDRCQDNFFNVSSQKGCLPCNCDYPNGALDHSCNQLTGQCNCHSGRSGKMCNYCKDGFWGDPTKLDGCTRCYCNLDGSVFKQCNRNNGVCRCKPGITGRHCDMCMKGTDGKMPNCSSCGDCWFQWDNFLIFIKSAFDELHNSSGVFITNVKFPKEINDICISVEQNLKFLKEIKKYFPIGYDINISNFSTKLSRLKYHVYKSNITDFNTKHYSIITIENSTDYAKAMISKNKIRDLTGAFNEIRKSLKNILFGINKSKMIYNKINITKEKLFYRNKELRKVNVKFIRKRSKDMDNLINEMSKNVNTFNGVTCNTITDNPLKCSGFCGGVGCKPDKCYRHIPMNNLCLRRNNKFFNLYAHLLQNRTNMFIFLKEFNKQINISINSKEIKEAYVKPESEYNTTIKLIDVTSGAIQSCHLESVNLLIKIRTYLNGSADLKDFESLIENINIFEINFEEKEIFTLENEIISKKKKLNNVNYILDKSKFNRKQCDVFKKSAVRAKKDTSYLLNSLKDISAFNYMTQNFEVIIKQFAMSFTKAFFFLKRNLFEVSQNENDAFQKQNNISYITERIKLSKLYIMKILKNFSNSFQQIKMKQNFQKAKFRNLKNDTKVVENNSNHFKVKSVSNSKISERFQLLINKSHSLYDKIKASHYKLKMSKNLILDKELKIQSLSKDFDEKLGRIFTLQDKIYSKSEFHAQCLP